MKILDSGERREFETGAVRDIQVGKGRFDLMPLQVVSRFLSNNGERDTVVDSIAAFTQTGETRYLYAALHAFSSMAYNDRETMLLEVAKHFEAGALKYGEDNWRKGLPVSCYIDSALRHYTKWRRGDNDEPHGRAFAWNIMCCIWEVEYHYDKN